MVGSSVGFASGAAVGTAAGAVGGGAAGYSAYSKREVIGASVKDTMTKAAPLPALSSESLQGGRSACPAEGAGTERQRQGQGPRGGAPDVGKRPWDQAWLPTSRARREAENMGLPIRCRKPSWTSHFERTQFERRPVSTLCLTSVETMTMMSVLRRVPRPWRASPPSMGSRRCARTFQHGSAAQRSSRCMEFCS